MLVALSGCKVDLADPTWHPRPAATGAVALAAGPEADAGNDAGVPNSAEFAPDAPALGLETRVIYSDAPGARIAARWIEIPGNDVLNSLLRGEVRRLIDENAAATGVAYVPRADGPRSGAGVVCQPGSASGPVGELLADPVSTAPGDGRSVSVVCEIVAATGRLVVQKIRIVVADGAEVQTDTVRTLYADTHGAFVAEPADLLDAGQTPQLLRSIVETLKIAAGAFEPAMQEDPSGWPPDRLTALFTDVELTPDGSLVVRLPRDFRTDELDALGALPDDPPLVVTVPAVSAGQYLTPRGTEIAAALAVGAPLDLPAAEARGREPVDCAFFACVALTFDDGPGRYTSGVLDELRSRRDAATFFVQGVNIGGDEDLVRRAFDEGHQIGNHTWAHPHLTGLSDADVRRELGETTAAIVAITGQRSMTYRPPYGDIDDRVQRLAGMPAILWSVDPEDWRIPDDATLLERTVDRPVPGDIVLCHDIHENTARMVPAILDGLHARGFTLVTVDQLLAAAPPGIGDTVRSAR
ncbi:hypothetical protein L3i23_29020 [Herbiconiux sp. L3-i23]|nr:hypothetical protein L3i23_29020 [Herbiconiux sp. L3-i23]